MMSPLIAGLVLSLSIPSLGVNSNSISFVWNNVQNDDANDYVLYIDGQKLPESARQNAQRFNKVASSYANSFYNSYTKKKTGITMIQTSVCFYTAENLAPDTEYKVRVAAVSKSGKEIFSSNEIEVRTLPAVSDSSVVNIVSCGAAASGDDFFSQPQNIQHELIKKNTSAIQKAIDACPSGGIVVVPEGNFVCGTIHLKSNMTLRIDGTLTGSPYASDYDFGFLLYPYYTDTRYWGIITADGAENIRICGNGTVNGNGWKYEDSDMHVSDTVQLYKEYGDDKNTPLPHFIHSSFRAVKDDGILARSCAESYLASVKKNFDTASDADLRNAYAVRNTTVMIRNVRGLFISGITFKNPANHIVNIMDSSDVSITGIKEFSYDSNNGDGIGIICTKNVAIWNNFIDTGDDSIVFSAGVGKAAFSTGEQGVSSVHIFGNYIHHGHGGVAFGSHTALGIKDVVIEDNIFSHTDIPFRFKSAEANGGEACDVLFRNNDIAECIQPFVFTTAYSDAGTVSPYGAAETPAVFHDIAIKNCSVYGVGKDVLTYVASEGHPHTNISFENVCISSAKGKTKQTFDEQKQYVSCKNVKFIEHN